MCWPWHKCLKICLNWFYSEAIWCHLKPLIWHSWYSQAKSSVSRMVRKYCAEWQLPIRRIDILTNDCLVGINDFPQSDSIQPHLREETPALPKQERNRLKWYLIYKKLIILKVENLKEGQRERDIIIEKWKKTFFLYECDVHRNLVHINVLLNS